MFKVSQLLIGIILLAFFSHCKKKIEVSDYNDPVSLNVINAGGDDYAVKLLPAPDGGYYLLGNSYLAESKYDVFFTHVNSKGFVETTRHFGGSDNDIILDVAMDDNGNIMAVGKTASSELFLGNGFYLSQYFFLCFDKTGNLKWKTAYTDLTAKFANQNVEDYATQVVADGNGSFWVCGTSRAYASYFGGPPGFNMTYHQATLFKVNDAMQFGKSKTFSLYFNDTTPVQTVATQLIKKSNGKMNMVVNKMIPETPVSVKPNFKILELNSLGDSIGVFQGWTKDYVTQNSNLLLEKDNSAFSYIYAPDGRYSNFTASGSMLNKVTISVAGLDQVWTASNAVMANNAIYVCGSLSSLPLVISGQGLLNIDNNIPLLVKMDLNGVILWTKKMDILNGTLSDLLLDAEGNILVAGTYKPAGAKTADLLIVKYKDDIIVNK